MEVPLVALKTPEDGKTILRDAGFSHPRPHAFGNWYKRPGAFHSTLGLSWDTLRIFANTFLKVASFTKVDVDREFVTRLSFQL